MGQVEKIFRKNFLEYASYVIKERAIADLQDGFKPVQRRIIHSLFEMDDGKFHKVANVVGWAMRYHPHGDSSIYEALVNLANYDLLIEKQGNFGNSLTGDRAAASRYIECRILPFAKKVLYNPELTDYQDSYDGRHQEPSVFPAKIPLVVIQGVNGIAVGMATTIFSHNVGEVLDAMKKELQGESIELFPDFLGGGFADVTNYDDGRGSIVVRAKLDISDPKRIIIKELPFGVTSERLISTIDDAAKKGRLKVSSINDYTAEDVNIEINLARGTYSSDLVKALYAYTDCEKKISCNPLVIRDNVPTIMGVTDIVKYHAHHLVDILTRELQLEKEQLNDKLQMRTLERIFVEERIYKKIEKQKTAAGVVKSVMKGFEPFADSLLRPVTKDDVDRLLKIPIRRISLFDINKNEAEIDAINAALELCQSRLDNIVEYSISYIGEIRSLIPEDRLKRKTVIKNIETVNVKDVAMRDKDLQYNSDNGYLGYNIKDGESILKISIFDKILVVTKDGHYRFLVNPEKEYVGKGLLYCGYADKEELAKVTFSLIMQQKTYKYLFIKRFQIKSGQLNKEYCLLPDPETYKVVKLSMLENAEIRVIYKPKPGLRIKEESFYLSDYLIKGAFTKGNRLTVKEVKSLRMRPVKEVTKVKEKDLFDENDDSDKDN
ncbi:MAG: DNA topoisomerase IV subunit A [Sphaerochaetaceae bacterium]|nr:DNA topoisomerase IV subunit A [Sphaerochaetaceae bacterium]